MKEKPRARRQPWRGGEFKMSTLDVAEPAAEINLHMAGEVAELMATGVSCETATGIIRDVKALIASTNLSYETALEIVSQNGSAWQAIRCHRLAHVHQKQREKQRREVLRVVDILAKASR